MRFRRILALLCASLFLISGASAAEIPVTEQVGDTSQVAYAASTSLRVVASTHKIQVNGQSVKPQAYNINGYNYFKLRDIAFMLNGTSASFDVAWDSSKNAISLLSGKSYTAVGGEMTFASVTTLKVQESTARLLLDGSTVSVKGYNINGNNYYKIADVATTMGFSATFDNATSTVHITTSTEPDTDFVPGVYRVKVDTTLSIRSGPGLTYSVIGSLKKDQEIVVDSVKNNWAHIQGDSERYCSMDYLVRLRDYDEDSKPVDPDPSDPDDGNPSSFTAGVYEVKVDTTLSVRSGPGFTYNVIGSLKKGEGVVIDSVTDNWGHIKGDASRYCSMDYLVRLRDYDPDSEPEEPEIPPRTSHLDGKMTIIIDPGHGGSDVGAHNADMSLDEKHVNLYVAQYLQQKLEQAGATVIMVRDTLEDGSSLSLRGQVMQQYADSADLFFSIHHNAATTTARGAEILAQIADKNGGPSKILAEALLEEYEKLGIPIRQIVFKEGSNGDYYYTNRVAASLQIPAVTSEFCFIDNEEDQTFIDSEEDWEAQAEAQYRAIMKYFEQVKY